MANCGTVVLVLLYTENNEMAGSDLLIYFKSTILERAGGQKSLPFRKLNKGRDIDFPKTNSFQVYNDRMEVL